MMDQHYHRWLDESIPALKGSTPRQAARSRALKPLLTICCASWRITASAASANGRTAYDPSWIWTELGLDEPGGIHDDLA